MEQNISFQQKNLVTKIFSLLVSLCSPSFIYGLNLNYLINYWKKLTIKIKPIESFVAANIIFDRNIGGFKQVTNWFKFDVFSCIEATIMQVWKSGNILVFIWKQYVEDFILKHLLHFEICARKIYEKCICKHSETIKYVKK